MNYLRSEAIQSADETQSVTKVYESADSLDEAKTRGFWRQIEGTLKTVFIREGGDKLSRALERLKGLKSKTETSRDPGFAPTVYHADPFQIAKDLAGVTVATAEQKELYIDLLRTIADDTNQTSYWPGLLQQISANDVARDVPDDPAPTPSN